MGLLQPNFISKLYSINPFHCKHSRPSIVPKYFGDFNTAWFLIFKSAIDCRPLLTIAYLIVIKKIIQRLVSYQISNGSAKEDTQKLRSPQARRNFLVRNWMSIGYWLQSMEVVVFSEHYKNTLALTWLTSVERKKTLSIFPFLNIIDFVKHVSDLFI